MLTNADVVIVGAGVIGLSVGFHLLHRSPGLRVTIVEQAEAAGTGSTAKATGGIRHQFAIPILVALSQQSLAEYRTFEALTGVDVEFEDVGYLLFSTSDAEADRLRAALAVQRAFGVEAQDLTAADIAHRWPYMRADDILLGVYTPGDGHANPYAAVTGYLQAFRRLGGRVILGERVIGIDASNRVTAVRTERQVLPASAVVNAAGVSAAEVAAMVGVTIPVRPFRRQIAALTSLEFSAQRVPFTMHTDSGWYLHRQSDGVVLLGGIDKDTHPGTVETVDLAVISRLLEVGLTRIPDLARAALMRSYAGLRALTPDDLPILGPVPAIEGFFCACGLAGHGFMHAPAVGDVLAQWLLHGTVDLPGLERCLPNRFAGTPV